MTQQEKKEYLAQLAFCRSFLFLGGFMSEKESEKIFSRVSKFQDSNQIEISKEEMESVEITFEKEYSFTKEELEARDRERDRRVAAEAWDDGSSSAYGNTKPEGPCRFDSTQHLKDKETYLNSLINK